MARAKQQFPTPRVTVSDAMALRQQLEDELRLDFAGDARVAGTNDTFTSFMHDMAEWLTAQGWVDDWPERFEEET